MTKTERKLLRAMLHKLECHLPIIEEWPVYELLYTHEEAKTQNDLRKRFLKDAKKLVTKLCKQSRKGMKPRNRLGDHFV